jgi:guanylate kinase
MREFPKLTFSVSVTTRKPRAGERDGVDYTFVDKETFERMAADGEFAEHAVVHGNHYGTTRAFVAQALEGGRDVLFDIDWQGGLQLKSQFNDDTIMVWILPPTLLVLEERLRRRATDSPDVIAARLRTAKLEELEHYTPYDYLVVNAELDSAYDALRSIYVAAHHTKSRQKDKAEKLLAEARNS